MKTFFALFVLSFFYTHCPAASVDMWSSPLKERAALKYEAIEPEVVKACSHWYYSRREQGGGPRVYFCREENWGAPCFAYRPELEYTCNELGPELKGHIGSVFVDPGMICRLAGFNNDRCAPIKIFAWPETQHGWPDLFHQNASGGAIKLGAATTHFTQDAFLQNGALLPVTHRDHFREETQLNDASDEQTRKPSTTDIISDQLSILQMVRDNLRPMRSQTPSPESVHRAPRSTSSSYHDQGTGFIDVPSPASDTRMPSLDLGDLTKYSRFNDRLSGLRSSSSSSVAARALNQGGTDGAGFDETPAFGHLQLLPIQSYHSFEIVSSSEDLQSNVTPTQKTMARQPSLEDTTGFGRTYPLTPVKARIRPHIDSPAEDRHSESPSPSTKPPRVERRSKRKSSVMSLRSLTEGVKRTRAGVEKLAHNICYNSCNKLRHAHRSVRRQHKEQRKHHSVWKALRRKFRPEDASKPRHEKASASFSIEQGGHGTESWWKAGVEKYHAPKWMRFGK
ncbi:hypothetical protein FPCIR_12047 [Fusarium pseudocircinatum]|uniref:Uncharacterized protein n=1 Tax=Fusarium pseudocircinatum TaxID=56676 RepID=A0A8H5KPD8_9HYPO|nr:hypothetical protein FPCIR_12047 [Fusarium pseudocircinatum]